MNTFTFSFHLLATERVCGAFEVRMKVPLTEEVYHEVCHRVQSCLHYILTHTQQEGELDDTVFCSMAYRDVLQAMTEASELFGEDAIVTLDRNIAFYRESGMDHLFRQDIELNIGAPRREQGEDGFTWRFVPLEQGWEELLR